MGEVPTFKELGVNWVDGAYRAVGVPKAATAEQRKRLSDLWSNLDNDPEMKELAAKNGFEFVNVVRVQMDAFVKKRTQIYTKATAPLGLGKK
jgi:tripartite-type tricarboxylate transporter receptor subunit TctC